MNTDKIIAEKIASEYAVKKTTFGIISSLVMGTGMCFAMGVIGDNSLTTMAIGIVIGLLGILGVSINYSLYKKLLAKGKQKYGNDIIQLAQEIANE